MNPDDEQDLQHPWIRGWTPEPWMMVDPFLEDETNQGSSKQVISCYRYKIYIH